MKTNEPLKMVVLNSLGGKVLTLGVPGSGMNRLLLLWKVEEGRGVFLGLFVYKITLQNRLFSNTNIRFLTLSTLPTPCINFTITLTVFGNFVIVY
jgi:hypothetical protein